MVCVAATYNLQKFFLYDSQSGELSVCPARVEAGPLLRAVPAATPRGDDLLAWFEELGRRCEGGVYGAERISQDTPSSVGLSLFPRCGPALARAVTRGIEVASSSVFAPEQGSCIYSIRIRLLPAAEGGLSPQVHSQCMASIDALPRGMDTRAHVYMPPPPPHLPQERGFETCQLHSRHWHLMDEQGQGEEVRSRYIVSVVGRVSRRTAT